AQIDIYNNGQAYANANGTCAILYAKLSYENLITDGCNYAFGDVVVRFYSDPTCTTPANVEYLPVKISAQCTNTTLCSSYEFDVTANGNYLCVGKSIELMWSEGIDDTSGPTGSSKICTKDYYLEFNNYYTIKN
ncbi:MAG TPA: hypothetical protein PK772_08170, partial [Chitinophagaceae bacterium]|nr:hypothetical protein [Chitinophagaceae bacterium]